MHINIAAAEQYPLTNSQRKYSDDDEEGEENLAAHEHLTATRQSRAEQSRVVSELLESSFCLPRIIACVSALCVSYECDRVYDLVESHDVRLILEEEDMTDQQRHGEQQEEQQRQTCLSQVALVTQTQTKQVEHAEEGENRRLSAQDRARIGKHNGCGTKEQENEQDRSEREAGTEAAQGADECELSCATRSEI